MFAEFAFSKISGPNGAGRKGPVQAALIESPDVYVFEAILLIKVVQCSTLSESKQNQTVFVETSHRRALVDSIQAFQGDRGEQLKSVVINLFHRALNHHPFSP
jgi:hypothetical protein